jgi:hypothetical protein
MKTKTVGYTLDTLPALTGEQHTHLEELAARSNDQLDVSAMPELTDAQLAEMKMVMPRLP